MADLTILHSSDRRAEIASHRFGCHCRPWNQLDLALESADVVITAEGGGRYSLEPAMIDALIARWRQAPAGSIIVATHNGKRGNPVLWPREYFARLTAISGDIGARGVLGDNRDAIVEVELGPAAGLDLDTPQALQAVGGTLED